MKEEFEEELDVAGNPGREGYIRPRMESTLRRNGDRNHKHADVKRACSNFPELEEAVHGWLMVQIEYKEASYRHTKRAQTCGIRCKV